jgi:UDP-glucose 4-epimerase
MGITVAVTGPTGEIGIPAVTVLEGEPTVERIVGMARRPFDPAARGWTKVEYRRGDILDRSAVDALVGDADVVVHLAYLIMGSRSQSRRTNLVGTRNVIEATVAAPRPRRFVYTSSLAAYGYHADNPVPLTEEVATRGSAEHYYSQEKAECEAILAELIAGSQLQVYILRPCVVAGPGATALADALPWNQFGARVSGIVRTAGRVSTLLRPILPDPGVPLQLVHHDDVASAITAAVLGRGKPGAYNLAGDGTISFSDVAQAAGGRGIRVPHAAVLAASGMLARLPMVPAMAEWVHAGRTPMLMDTRKAKRDLGWRPRYTSKETLDAMAAAL